MTEPVPDVPVPDASAPAGTGAPSDASTSWWRQHRRQVWLWLAFLAAVTAPFWGGLLLLWLFSPSSPFPKG